MEFSGNLKSIYKQIGNAVPCKLAEIVATHLYGLLANIA
jgi:site-specific DNA-cytosine methylase